MKRVLLTGATGFIGRHCLPLLVAKGYEVHAVSSRLVQEGHPNVHWHQTNLLDTGQVTKLMATVHPTHLLHLAWYAVPGKYWTAVENVLWVQASLDLLRAFVRHNGQRAVIAGTCAEYDWNYGYCSENITPLAPITLYGVCKHALQMMLMSYAGQAKFSIAWGRIFFLYGPHEHSERLVASVIRALQCNEVARCSHGNQIRDFLYVHDVADAFVTLLESNVTGPINIASGQPVAIKDVIDRIAGKLNQQSQVQLGAVPTSANDPPLLLADVRRLRDEVGWMPHYELERGLDQTIGWWRDQLPVGRSI